MLVVDDDDDVLLEQEIEAAQPEGEQSLPDAPAEPDVVVDVDDVSAADFSLLPLAEALALAHSQGDSALADENFLALRRAIRRAQLCLAAVQQDAGDVDTSAASLEAAQSTLAICTDLLSRSKRKRDSANEGLACSS